MINARRKTYFIAHRTAISAVCLALGMVLPFITGSIPEVGNLLSPMHLPVYICGAVAGPVSGGIVGIVLPILRGLIFGAPMPLVPRAVAMSVELMGYGVFFGLLMRVFPKKVPFIYVSLVSAMIIGRVFGSLAKLVLYTLGKIPQYSFSILVSSYIIESWPGMILQIAVIPPIIIALRRLKFLKDFNI